MKDFKEFLEKCKVLPGSAIRELIPLMKKEYLPLIEDLFRKGNVHPFVISNLLSILGSTNTEISEKVIETILEGIINSQEIYIGFFDSIPFYLIHYKKKKYCGKLKQILEVHGTKEKLVDRTPGILCNTLLAVKELGCTECLPKLREISSYGLTKMNGRISISTEEALEKLDKNYKSEYLDKYGGKK